MKKIILFTLINFVFGICYSQNKEIHGVVLDSETKQYIEGVSITVAEDIFTLTNAEGGFVLFVPENSKEIVFSHIAYQDKIIKLNDKNNALEVYLTSEAYTLDELVVNTVSTNDILKNAYENSLKKLEKNTILETYYREFINNTGKEKKALESENLDVTFSDGLLDYYVKSNGKSDVYVKQSRALSGDIDSLKSQKVNSSIDVREVMNDAYQMPMIKHLLKSDNYNFFKDFKEDSNGKGMYFIKVVPKENVEAVLYEGEIIIDEEHNLIIETEFKTSEEHYNKYAKSTKLLGYEFKNGLYETKVGYKLDGNKYIPYFEKINTQSMFTFTLKGEKVNISYYTSTDLIVTGYKANVNKVDKAERFRERTLYNAGKNYNEEYWKTKNSLLLTKKDQEILNKLIK